MHLLLLQGTSEGVTTAATTTEEMTTAIPTTTAGTYTFKRHNFNSLLFKKQSKHQNQK